MAIPGNFSPPPVPAEASTGTCSTDTLSPFAHLYRQLVTSAPNSVEKIIIYYNEEKLFLQVSQTLRVTFSTFIILVFFCNQNEDKDTDLNVLESFHYDGPLDRLHSGCLVGEFDITVENSFEI